jgi:hypothetical protein
MNSELIDKKLKKINNIYNEFKLDGKITTLERDLLLAYIRELYDLIKDDTEGKTSLLSEVKPIEVTKAEISQIMVTETPTKVEKVEPIKVEVPFKNVEVSSEIKEVKAKVEEEVAKEAPMEEAIPEPEVKMQVVTSQTAAEKPKVQISSQITKLFVIEKAKDISERLAMSPISDISKAMSINDRMLVSKDLFGKNGDLFNQTLISLNAYSDFDSAKELLMPIAQQFLWADEENKEKAENFIKLVSRRYSSK